MERGKSEYGLSTEQLISSLLNPSVSTTKYTMKGNIQAPVFQINRGMVNQVFNHLKNTKQEYIISDLIKNWERTRRGENVDDLRAETYYEAGMDRYDFSKVGESMGRSIVNNIKYHMYSTPESVKMIEKITRIPTEQKDVIIGGKKATVNKKKKFKIFGDEQC